MVGNWIKNYLLQLDQKDKTLHQKDWGMIIYVSTCTLLAPK